MASFSERQGLDSADAEITIRQDAPPWLRGLIVDYAYESGWTPTQLRRVVCRELMETPNPANWSEFPNVDGELRDLLAKAPWFVVFDLIEKIAKGPTSPRSLPTASASANPFASLVNRMFHKKGVGWQLVDGQVQVRGPELFEAAMSTAVDLAGRSGRATTRSELHGAVQDLSRRPEPDLTGAIRHAMAALECAARDITGQPNLTLGQWIAKNRTAFPAPLDQAAEKLWAYSSEHARHLREGRVPKAEDAELVVGVAAALTTYLLRKV